MMNVNISVIEWIKENDSCVFVTYLFDIDDFGGMVDVLDSNFKEKFSGKLEFTKEARTDWPDKPNAEVL